MVTDTRIDIYDFVYNMVYGVVTKNVYSVSPPQELTESDTKDGFIVITAGQVNDESEFLGKAYGWVRVYIEAYIPTRLRGRADKRKIANYERLLNSVINQWNDKTSDDGFSIDVDTIISDDDVVANNKDNVYHVLVKSFVVYKNDSSDATYKGDFYLGCGGDVLQNRDDIETLTNVQHYNVDEPFGDYSIFIPSTNYVWLCTTKTINKVLSSEIEVPMEEPIIIDEFSCYRTSNAILEGQMDLEII